MKQRGTSSKQNGLFAHHSLRWLETMRTFHRNNLFFLVVYGILPYVFFGVATNVVTTALAPGDGGLFGLPIKIFAAGMHPWNPYIQGGTFSFADIGWQAFYPPGLVIMRVFPNPFGYNLLLLLHYSMAGYFTFLFLRALRMSRISSFVGGLTFMFCGFLTAHKGHHSMMMTASYLPVVLYFLETAIRSRSRARLPLAAMAFGLCILADYTAVSMYIGMVTFPYLLFRVFGGAEWRDRPAPTRLAVALSMSAVVYLAGVLLAAVEIVPVLESLQYVTRQQISYDFFTSYSFSFRLLPILLFPYAYGTQSPGVYQVFYFGPWNLTEMTGYMGILPILFALLAFVFFRRHDAQVRFWTAIGLFGLILVLGASTPLYRLLYQVPIYNLFRAPARNWVEVNFAVATLSALFVHHAMAAAESQWRHYVRAIRWTSAVLGLLVLFILSYGQHLFPSPGLEQSWSQNMQIASAAVWIPLIVMLISITLLQLIFRYRAHKVFWAVTAIVIFLDLFSFGHFHDTGYPSYEIFQGQRNAIADFLNGANGDKSQYRILALNVTNYEDQLYPCINLLYDINVTNGYGAIWLKDYSALTTFQAEGTAAQKTTLLQNSAVLSVLSTKYLLATDPADKAYLQTLYLFRGTTAQNTLVESLSDIGWERFAASRTTSGTTVLESPAGGQVSLIQFPFAIQPNSSYIVSFKARQLDSSAAGQSLNIDFFGQDYDLQQEEIDLDASIFSKELQPFELRFKTGEATPSLAYLRVFTYSKSAYEIADVTLTQDGGGIPYWGAGQLGPGQAPLYAPQFETSSGITVYENMNFLPRARFVQSVRDMPSAPAVIKVLKGNSSYDPATMALVQDYEGPTQFEPGQVVKADYTNESSVSLTVNIGRRAFLVLSDSWYPGWKAYVDGKQTSIYQTNAVSRGIVIEGAGPHQVIFRFEPTSLYIGIGITASTFILLLLGLLLSRSGGRA
jgi:hypothetical protein